MNSLVHEVAIGTVRVDRSMALWKIGALGSVVVTALMLVFIKSGLQAEAVPVAVGALFVPLAGVAQTVGRRFLTQLWTMLWLMVLTLVGSLVSQPGIIPLAVGVLLAPFVAFGTGFVSGAGPAARMACTLSLVCYAIFMGIPDTPVDAVRSALLLGLGGSVQIVVFTVVRVALNRQRTWGAERIQPGVVERLKARWSRDDDFMRHGVRLALAFTTATVISQLLTWPHQYWIPMTVAWVALPDATGTATKVAARMAGTLVGLAIVTPVIVLLKPDLVGIALLVGLGALLAQTFLTANYTVCVAGVTIFVMALFTLIGDPVGPSVVYRIIDTFIAGFIAVAFSLVWPSVSHQHRHRFRRRPSSASTQSGG